MGEKFRRFVHNAARHRAVRIKTCHCDVLLEIANSEDVIRCATSMLLTHPGPAFQRPTNGLTPTRKEAARDLIACWQKFRAYYGID